MAMEWCYPHLQRGKQVLVTRQVGEDCFRDGDGRLLHESGCECERCRNLIAAMLAKTPDGEYFFSDEEITQIVEAEEA